MCKKGTLWKLRNRLFKRVDKLFHEDEIRYPASVFLKEAIDEEIQKIKNEK